MNKFALILITMLFAQISSASELSKESSKKYYLGATTTLANYNSIAVGGPESVNYDIDPKLLTSVEGRFKLTKRLNGLLNVNFDSGEVDRTFNILGAIATKTMLLRLTSGKLSGRANLSSTINGSAISFDQDLEMKYLAADILFRVENNWIKRAFDCEDLTCYHGLRAVSFTIPGSILTAGRFGDFDFSDAPSFLDPEFEVKGLFYTVSLDSLRNKVLGLKSDLGSEKDSEGKGDTDSDKDKKPANRIAMVTSMSLGYGAGTVSERGKANILSASGKTLENDSREFFLLESSFAGYYTWDLSNKNRSWLIGLGYMVQMHLAYDFDFDIGEEPADTSKVQFDSVGVGYFLHGPSFVAYASF